MEIAVDRGQQRRADHVKAGDRDRRIDDRQGRAGCIQDQGHVLGRADHQPGVDAGGKQADEDLARFGGDRGDLAERFEFREVVGEHGAGEHGTGEMLGQEPWHVPEILAAQIRPAQLLRPPAPMLARFDGRSRTESFRSFFEPLGGSGFGLLVHVLTPMLCEQNLSASRSRRECQRARLSLPALDARSAVTAASSARSSASW